MGSGRIYDQDEASRIRIFLNTQHEELTALEKEDQNNKNRAITIAIVIAGALLVFSAFKIFVSKK